MRLKLRALALALCLCALSFAASHRAGAQNANVINTCGTAALRSGTSQLFEDTTGNLCTAASVSASISGFTAATVGTPISVTTGGVTGSLPAGAVVVASNAGATNTAYCALGASATTSNQPIQAGSWFAFTVGASTQLTCITSTSTTTVNMVGGAGLPTGAGGGGGGASGAVTIASGADVAEGAIGDAAWVSGNATMIGLGKAIVAGVNGAIPAGSALIGKVGVDQTTPGTTNGVAIVGVNAATALAGAGATGTGSQRVTAAQDTTTIAGSAPGTAGSASTNVVTVQGIASGTTLPITQSSQYPVGATAITASATGTTAATTATLAGTSAKTTFICGYSIRANATAAATVTNTITGVITATLSSIMWVAPLASGIGVDEQVFFPCIPASGTNQAIAIVSGAPGSGGTVSAKGWGYQQ